MEHRCHVDSEPCEVVAMLAPRYRAPVRKGRRLDLALAREPIVRALPCAWCREVERSAESIARVRLGRHERNILLHAPPADSVQGAILDPSLKTHSDRETYLRAVRKLGRAGLIRTGERHVAKRTTGKRLDGSAVDRVYAHRTMWLTPFGAQVIECYRRELEEGRAIRWMLRMDRARSGARRVGTELVERFAAQLARAWDEGHAVSADPGDNAAGEIDMVIRRALDAAQLIVRSTGG